MHLSRVQESNFRNFAELDVVLSENVVLVGENRVGKVILFSLFGSSLTRSCRTARGS